MRSTLTTPPPSRARRVRAIAIVIATLIVATVCTHLVITQYNPALTPAAATESGPLGDDDGYIGTGDSISPFADELPAIAKLDPALREAMQAAATAALADGFDFVVTSGWRSERYQQALFDEAVLEYGIEEASRLVATSTTSAHVTGRAVDIGFTDANSWLSQHGSDYGLCQTFANEMWHFELATTPGGVCPPQLPDASYR